MIEVRKPNPIPKMLMTRVTALPGIRYIPSLYALPFKHKGKHFNSVHRILYAVSNFYPPSVSSFSLPLQADVGNDDGALLPGMTVIARITAGERENVAAVPLAALDNIRGQDVLYTAGDPKTGKLSAPAAVELGISDGDYAELLGGLEEGTAFYYYPYD